MTPAVECNLVYVTNNDKACTVPHVKCCGCEVEGEATETSECVNDIPAGISEAVKLHVPSAMENCMSVNDTPTFKEKPKGGKMGDKVTAKAAERFDKVKNFTG